MAKVIGNTTTTPMAIPDWNQTDETKADYIKNKPKIPSKISDLTNDAGYINNIDDALSDSSTNPVQNKVVNAAISNLNTLVGDTAVAEQINSAVAQKSQVQIITWEDDD